MTIQEKVGSRLKELRKLKGFSQETLGFEAQVHRTYINDVENGRRNISINTLGKIVKALDVTLSEFFVDIE